MSKVITSPLQRWAGTVTIADPLTLPQAHLIEEGLKKPEVDGDKIWTSFIDDKKLPAVIGCVEKWELQNFPPSIGIGNFPASPRGDSHKLIEWIFSELFNIYVGELEIPNA